VTAVDAEQTGREGTAAALGLEIAAAMLDTSWAGIVLIDEGGRYLYANPAAGKILGRPSSELVGREFTESFVPVEAAGIEERLRAARISHDRTGLFLATVAVPDGTQREITYSNAVFEVAGARYLSAVFRDTSGTRQAAQEAAALAQTATQLANCDDPNVILARVAEHAVHTTRASACGIAVLGPDGTLRSAGGWNLPVAMRDQVINGTRHIEDFPGGDEVAAGRIAKLADARAAFAARPRVADIAELLSDLDWRGSVFLPMRWGGEVIGVFGVYLPAAVERVTQDEITFWEALSDQAATAVIHARMRSEREQHAAVTERQRLARELHDSVSQALFSMTLHARTAQLALDREGCAPDGAVARSIGQLRELTQGALAEMRALIFELRPGALTEEGLVAALTKQAAALSSREALAITVTGPQERPRLAPSVEEHLYRIALEALNNTVKHAGASEASVVVEVDGAVLRMRVSDDGCGFDTTARHPGHLGLGTMTERADAVDGVLTVHSVPGQGTEIDLHMVMRE
jgi:PAS domain S-box-containing protein